VVSSVDPLGIAEPLLESLGFKETIVKSSESRRLGGWDLSWFLFWRGGLAKEVSNRVRA
jgi:hypothetical protein